MAITRTPPRLKFMHFFAVAELFTRTIKILRDITGKNVIQNKRVSRKCCNSLEAFNAFANVLCVQRTC